MRIIFTGVFLSVLLLSFGQDSGDRDVTPKYSNEFLNIGVSARAFGMGFTSISFIDDVTAGYWNPSGLNDLSSDHHRRAWQSGIAQTSTNSCRVR